MGWADLITQSEGCIVTRNPPSRSVGRAAGAPGGKAALLPATTNWCISLVSASAAGGRFDMSKDRVVAEPVAGPAGEGTVGPCKVLMIFPRFCAESFWNYVDTCKLMNVRYPAAPLGLMT